MISSQLISEIEEEANRIYDWVKKIREHIHMFPELSFKEFETSAFVIQKLKEIGVSDINVIADTGVVALISNHQIKDKNCIGLRSDLDALPIKEINENLYCSKNDGVMHACGHDVHTSILLGAARIIYKNKEKLRNPVKFIFQPGEEVHPGGASILIKNGVLENPKVEKIFALHVYPEMEVGKIGLKSGMYMASSDELHVEIDGVGGHGVLPEKCVSPIEIGSEVIIESKKLVKKLNKKDIPSVISFGYFVAEGATNVIPDRALIKGTFRTMNEEWREEIICRLTEQISEIGKKYGGKAELRRSKGYPCLINDDFLVKEIKENTKKIIGKEYVEDLDIRMTAEDFSFYSSEIPSCFFRLGVRNESQGIIHSVHNPKFDIDPESLKIGTKIMASIPFIWD